MEETLEDTLSELVRHLTSSSCRVEVNFNGSSLLRLTTANRSAPLMGTETLNFLVMCKGRSKRSALKLARETREVLSGVYFEAIDPQLTALWCPSTSYVGEGPDGFHDVALTLTTTRPYIKEITIC